MKVVHISTSDINGGAAIAAIRLHKALLEEGIDSKMLVMSKKSDELNIDVAKKGKMEKFIFSNVRKLINIIPVKKYRNREKIIFSPANYGLDISKHPWVKEADIIHLHWIVGGYISLNSLKKIAKLGKKVIWTLHDSWAFTGGCHVRYGCEKYQNKCGKCPILKSNKENDLSRKVFLKKQRVFSLFKDLTIVTPSNWLGDCARKSSLLSNFKIKVIPNTLDTDIFKPINKEIAKEILNFDKDKKYICFGAINATTTPYKGWIYLKKALELLNEEKPDMKKEVELLVFGASHSDDIEKLPFRARFMGRIYDEYTLALIYNAADVFVAPSLEDNLPNTVLESLHCGTTVVAFNVGGMPDMITHKKNGYLAEYKNVEDLARGIDWCLGNLEKVNIDNEEFKIKHVLKDILNLYTGLN